MSIKLNIGGGGLPIPGFIEVDRRSGGEAYPLRIPDHPDLSSQFEQAGQKYRQGANPGERYWELADDSVDEIRASHVLEHFGHRQVMDVLREWVRVLKPGGRIRIAVPDFAQCVKHYTDDDTNLPIMGYIFGGQSDENDYHKSAFDQGLLSEMLRALGINDIRRWTSEIQDCAALPISLNLEGFKRQPLKIEGLAVISSRNRLGFTLHEWCSHNALYPLGLRPVVCTGVFWSHGLTELMEAAIDAKYRYILTLDHDTAYTRHDVEDLYELMERTSEADAICATQMLREGDRVLAVIKGDDGKYQTSLSREELAGDLLKLSSGHFGLTILRVSSYARFQRPWFCEAPDPDGRWGDKRLDADASFWQQWRKSGNTLFQANRVVIGHLEEQIRWPSRHLTPLYQPASEFMKKGKPTGVLR